MADPWAGSGGSGGAPADPWAAPPQLQTSSGWGWNPAHWISRALGNASSLPADIGKGVKGLGEGVGQFFAKPMYHFADTALSAAAAGGEKLAGNDAAAQMQWKHATSAATQLGHDPGDMAVGMAQMFNTPVEQLASGLGAGKWYENSGPGAALRYLGTGSRHGENALLSPEVAQQLQSHHTTGFGAAMKQGGFTGAVISDVLPAAIVLGATAEPYTAGAADAAVADSMHADAMQHPNAPTYADTAAKLETRAGRVRAAAHPIKAFGEGLADVIGAAAQKVTPGYVGLNTEALLNEINGVPTADVAAQGLHDLAQSAPDAALNPTREVLGAASAEADAAAIAKARALMDPTVASAESIAGNAEAAKEVTPSPAPSEADKLKIPERPGNTPSGTDEVRQGVQAQVDAARETVPTTYVEDATGKRVSLPAPAWAVRVASILPDSVNRVLAHLEVPIDASRVKRYARDLTRYVEISQTVEQRSPAMDAANAQIAEPIRQATGLPRQDVTRMVGEEIMGVHDGAQLIEAFIHRYNGIDPVMEQSLVAAAKRGYKGIPKEVMDALPPEVRDQVVQGVKDAAEAFKLRAKARLDTLISSRYGAQGLEAALLPPDSAMPMSADVNRLWQRVLRNERAAMRARAGVAREDAFRQRRLDEAVLGHSKADEAVIELQRKHGITLDTVQSLHDGIPPGVENADGTADALIDHARTNWVNSNGEFFGATWDVAKSRDASGDGPISVGTAEQWTPMTREMFNGPEGRAAVIEAIRFPKTADGGHYDAASLWSGLDAHLGIWEDNGLVYGDISINTRDGVPLDELQARAIGEAYKQIALWDQSANGGDGANIQLSQNPNTQAVYGHYLPDLLNPKSSLSRLEREINKVAADPAINMTPAEVEGHLRFAMTIDLALSEMNPEAHPHGTTFDRMTVELGKQVPTKTHLTQTIMRMTTDQLVDYGLKSLDAAKVSQALRWYFDSHDYIESTWRGKDWPMPDVKTGATRDAADVFYDVLAVTSVMANPASNFGRALMGFANFDDMVKGQANAVDAAKAIMDRAFADNAAGISYVADLGLESERVVGDYRKGTAVADRWLNTPEFRKLTESTSMVTTPKYNVVDILTGRLNLETATNADIAEQYRAWTGKPRGNASEMNFPRDQVARAADVLGLKGPGIEAYKAWVARRTALEQANTMLKVMVKNGSKSKEAIAGVLATVGEDGVKTQKALADAIKASKAEEAALRQDPEVTKAFEQAIMEYHGSKALAKLRSFRDNLANPHESLAVTLDSVMASGYGMLNTAFNNSNIYATYAAEVRATAARLSQEWGRPVMPHEVQALVWVAIKAFVGKQDWGRLLAHHDIAHDTLNTVENAVRDGGRVDPRTFQPFQSYWEEEIGFSIREQGDREERAQLNRDAKRRSLSPEEQARLDEINQREAVHEAQVMTTPDRQNPGDTWLTSQHTEETRLQISDNKTKMTKKMEQYDVYRKLEKEWQQSLAEGDFTKVRKGITSYIEQRKESVLGDAEGGSFAVEGRKQLANPESSSAKAMDRLQTTQYVPQPNADVLHTTGPELHQQIQDTIRGALLVDPDTTGRLIIRLFSTADLGTLVHENAHLLRQILTPEMLDRFFGQYPSIEGRFPSGNLPIARIADEERFVSDLGQYMRDKAAGRTAPSHLADVFERAGSLMEDTLGPFLDTAQGRALPNDIVAFFDRLFQPDIVAPDQLHDPLSAQYVKPGEGVNTKQYRWESDAQFAQRTRQYGEARARSVNEVADIARAKSRAAKADAAVVKMQEIMLEPTAHELLANRLSQRAAEDRAKIVEKLGNPGRSDVPPAWRNILEAFQGVAEIAKTDKTGATAEMLAEIPTTFADVLKFASEAGFEPTHVPDLTWEQAQKYLFQHMPLVDNESNLAKLRRENTGVLYKRGLADRSLEALGAANVMATRELYRGKLVDFIEKYYAQHLPVGTALPDGWRFWAPEKQAIITGTHPAEGKVAVNTELIVPEGVSRALNGMRKSYSYWPFRFLKKGTQPWKTVMLTYSPSWYIKHFVGAIGLATLEGARMGDFRDAWRQWKTDSLPDVVRGRSQFGTNGDRTVIKGAQKFRDLPSLVRSEGYKQGIKDFNQKLNETVKAVDSMSRAAVYSKWLKEGKSVEFATTRAFEALGDFTNLNPFERDIVTAVLPFYAFSKAMFKILVRLPADHPAAAGLFLTLGRMQQQEMEKRLGAYPDSAIGGGFTADGHLVNFAKLSPLTESFRLITAEGIGQSINPFIRPLFESVMGVGGFNGTPGMGARGQLITEPNWGKEYIGAFTSTGLAGQAPLVGQGNNSDGAIASLIRTMNPTKTYTDAQLQALIKRIKRTQEAEAIVKQGGYLQTVANKAKSTAPSATNPWGG